jgi:hypothetical protein
LGVVAAVAAVSASSAPVAHAQITLTGSGPYVYTQNFDSLGTGNQAWTDNSTLQGWYLGTSLGTQSFNLAANNGNSGAENFYNFGSGSSVNGNGDRALGSIAGNVAESRYYALQFFNNTGADLASFTINFTLEQWRGTTNVNPGGLLVQYKVASDATNQTTLGGYQDAGFVQTPRFNFASDTALDGNLAINQAAGSFTINQTVANGEYIWVRWTDNNEALNDNALGIDGVTASFQPVPAPPALVALMIGSLVGSVQFGRTKLRRQRSTQRKADEAPSA